MCTYTKKFKFCCFFALYYKYSLFFTNFCIIFVEIAKKLLKNLDLRVKIKAHCSKIILVFNITVLFRRNGGNLL